MDAAAVRFLVWSVDTLKVVFIAPWIPSRIRPRSLGILAQIVGEHEVHFVGVDVRGEIADDLPRESLSSIRLLPISVAGGLCRAAFALVGFRSLQAAYPASRSVRRAVEELIIEVNPDVVVLNVARSFRLLPESWKGPVITDLDEFRSDYYRDSHALSIFGKVVGFVEGRRIAGVEAALVERSEAVLFSSARDAKRAGSKGHAVPSVVEPPKLTRKKNASSRRVIMVGRFGYAPNLRGAKWFLDEVWPQVQKSVPAAHVDLVGEKASRQLRQRASSTVHITGAVSSVWPYYEEATLAIVPITAATGVQLKLLQALALGVPTVVTPLVAELAGVEDGQEVLIARTRDEWVNAVTRLLRDESFAAGLAERGQRWFARNFSPEESSRRLLSVFQELNQSLNS